MGRAVGGIGTCLRSCVCTITIVHACPHAHAQQEVRLDGCSFTGQLPSEWLAWIGSGSGKLQVDDYVLGEEESDGSSPDGSGPVAENESSEGDDGGGSGLRAFNVSHNFLTIPQAWRNVGELPEVGEMGAWGAGFGGGECVRGWGCAA